MSDYRAAFLRSVEENLAGLLDPQTITLVTDRVTKVLSEYEITERCTDIVPTDPVNDRLIKRYCACLLVDGKSKHTIYGYRRTIKRFSDFIGKPLTEVGAYELRYFLACEKERGLADVSVENERANLSSFYQWMTLEDVIPKNPMLKIKKIQCHQEIKKPFSDVEIDSLRSGCKTAKERALIEILISTGIRVEELSNLEISDINVMDMSVHVRHGKGNKERITYTTTISLKHLRKYLDSRKEQDSVYLFCNRDHGQLLPGGIRYILNEIAERAGVENVHPHRFRRTFATNLSKRGMPIEEIRKLLGHSSLNTTKKYVCTDDEQVKMSYKKYIA